MSGQVCCTLYLPLYRLKPKGRAEKGNLDFMKAVQLESSSPEFCHIEMATPLCHKSALEGLAAALVAFGLTVGAVVCAIAAVYSVLQPDAKSKLQT